MPRWKMISYKDREIETEEDIMWLCGEVVKAYKSDNIKIEDMMALSFLEELHKDHIEEGRFGFIESRFDILDL